MLLERNSQRHLFSIHKVEYATSIKYPYISRQPYYTPKFTKFQAILAKMQFFVDYDGYLCQQFYVNFATKTEKIFTVFNYFSISRGCILEFIPNIDFAIFPA